MINRLFVLASLLITVACFTSPAIAQDTSIADKSAPAASQPSADATMTTKAAAAVASGQVQVESPDFLELLVDGVLEIFDVRTGDNTVTHYAVAAMFLVAALLGRRIVTLILFPFFYRISAKTKSNLDNRLFSALEAPVAAFIMVVGIFAALKVLKLSLATDQAIGYGSRVAFSLVVFWGLWRALSALLEHGTDLAKTRKLGITPFMPWIKKSLMTVFVVFGVLLTFQSLGYDVKAILTGLGIGGLAFALAAQDTLANIFGAIVVAVDQPFRLGEVVKIQGNVGSVEDVGLRSTRIRLVDGPLMVIPNKIVAAETITNLSRFVRRRFEQVIGLSYDTPPEQMEALVEEIRGIITSQPEVNAPGVMVFFRDFSASSLDIWIVYDFPDPDFQKAIRCKQRINGMIMRAIAARGLSLALPTQRVQLEGDAIQKIADRDDNPPPETPTAPAGR
ncbi:MAG TPA: mechanosensitive ion channel family protein [Opitutus sp.]|nr:mechanosensitive ion channel family protein [Opitutus sp.]